MNRREKATKFSRELANVLERLRPDTATASPNCSNPNAECSKLAPEPTEYGRIVNGRVGERLKPAVLKTYRKK
jgi:hypothetical protein